MTAVESSVDVLAAQVRESLIAHAVQLPLKRREHAPALEALDALVARVTELADSCARVTRAFEKEAARAADARNALERIAAAKYVDHMPEMRSIAREVLARLDGSAEPCPYCGCPGRDFDGHVCEDYLAARLDGSSDG